MPVLRIETKTIPTKTIETSVIGIPADEWKSMRRKKGTMTNIPPFLFLISLVGILIFGVGYWPSIVEQYNIDVSSDGFLLVEFGVSLAIGIPLATSMVFLPSKGKKLENALLKKHGWDGKSRYRVELEQPQHFPLD
ncbi:MAG: hypothetical protein RLZZ480_431 [Candidatus Parcubacteria bacterium]|jgi:hypothetical protein